MHWPGGEVSMNLGMSEGQEKGQPEIGWPVLWRHAAESV